MSETRRTSWTDLINRICPSRDETSLAPEAGNVSVGLNRAVTVSARWVNTNQSPRLNDGSDSYPVFVFNHPVPHHTT